MFDRRLLSLSGVPATLAWCCILALAAAVAAFGQAAGLAGALDVLRAGSPLDRAGTFLGAFVVSFVALRVLASAQDALADERAHRVSEGFRELLMGRLFDTAGSVAAAEGSGAFASLTVEGVSQVHTYLRLVLPRMANLAFQTVPLVLCVALLDWVSGIIVAAVVPVIVFYLVLLGKQAKETAKEQLSRGSYLSGHFLDSVYGLPTLVAFGRDGEWGASVRRASDRFREATMATLKVATLSGAVLDLACTLTGAAVAVMLGFRLVDGSLSFLCAFTVLLLVPQALAPLKNFASDFHATLDGRESLTRVLGLVSIPSEDVSAAEALPSEVRGKTECPGSSTCGDSDGSAVILCENAGFSRDGAVLLSNIALTVRAGSKVAVVGRSGSGKSTLLRLLAGMDSPSSGSVTCPDDGCIPLSSDLWRGRVSFIPQRATVLTETLRDNVTLYNPDASDARVKKALDTVGLSGLLAALPEGLDTLVGRGGRALSGGQAQRVALARMLVDPARDILLLDEPTAALDPWTEEELMPAVLAAMEGRTAVMATHRLSWLHHFDYVVVLDRGRVVAQGDAASMAAVLGIDGREDRAQSLTFEHLSASGSGSRSDGEGGRDGYQA